MSTHDDVTSILEETPGKLTEVELFTEREDLEEIASRVISETLRPRIHWIRPRRS